MKTKTSIELLSEQISGGMRLTSFNEAAYPKGVPREITVGDKGKTSLGGTFKVTKILIVYHSNGNTSSTVWYQITLSNDHPTRPNAKFNESNLSEEFFRLIMNEY